MKRDELVARARSVDWHTFNSLAEKVRERFVLLAPSGKEPDQETLDNLTLLILIGIESERDFLLKELGDRLSVVPPEAVTSTLKVWVKTFDTPGEIGRAASFPHLFTLVRYLKGVQFQEAFPFVVELLREQGPERIGAEIAQRTARIRRPRAGEHLFGLPRPADIRRWHRDLSPSLFSSYQRLWRAAFRAFTKRRADLKAQWKLVSYFRQSWNLQRRSIQRLFAEEEDLRSKGHSSASIVWSCIAVEVFLGKVVMNALIRAFVVNKEMASQEIDEFTRTNGKADKIKPKLKDHYKISLEQSKDWSAYKKAIEYRNEIVHGGRRGLRHEAELFAASARSLVEEIRNGVTSSVV